MRLTATFAIALLALQTQQPAQPASPIPATHLQTKWAADVNPEHPLPEYPRPQMERKQWSNLNGPWTYAIVAADAPRPATFDKKIIVPYPIESPGPGAVRQCVANYVQEFRPSGTVIVPRMRCWWARAGG